jgi:hypothetical protein
MAFSERNVVIARSAFYDEAMCWFQEIAPLKGVRTDRFLAGDFCRSNLIAGRRLPLPMLAVYFRSGQMTSSSDFGR